MLRAFSSNFHAAINLRFSINSISIRKLVFAVCAATWVVRLCFVSYPVVLSNDEVLALTANSYEPATEFLCSTNWAERWVIVDEYSRGGRVLGILLHLLWGCVYPSDGETAWALNAMFAVVAMAALSLAARRLYGERGFLLCLLFISVSPLFLNYMIRLLATMGAVMWISLALWVFASPKWGLKTWLLGGFFLGVAFGTHYATGTVILALAAGLACALLRIFFCRGISLGRKGLQCFVYPLLGVAVAVAPLGAVELWARYSGGSYLGRLTSHENLHRVYWLGPYGLWLREMIELDPLLEVLLFAAIFATFQSKFLGWGKKIFLALGYLLTLALVVVSFQSAPSRAYISVALFAAIGSAAVLFRALKSRWLGEAATAEEPDASGQSDRSPLAGWPLAVSLLAMAAIFTRYPAVSNMPRLAFPGWTLILLGMTGLLLKLFADRYDALMRGTAVVGIALFMLGAGASARAKGLSRRVGTFVKQREYLKKAEYAQFFLDDYIFPVLNNRAREKMFVFSPPYDLYPASCYEEEFDKVFIRISERLVSNRLDRTLKPEQLAQAQVFYEASAPDYKSFILPPPATPDVPSGAKETDSRGKPFSPPVHPSRGLELRFPRMESKEPVELSATFDLPAEIGRDSTFGFEYMLVGPKAPFGSNCVITIYAGDKPLSPNIVVSQIITKATKLQLFTCPVKPEANPQPIRVTAKLVVPSAKDAPPQYCPPVSVYIRRPFIQAPAAPRAVLSGFSAIIQSPETLPTYGWPKGAPCLLALARKAKGTEPTAEIRWKSAPWSGNVAQPLAFASSFNGVRMQGELSVNGREAMIFYATPFNLIQKHDGYTLEYVNLATTGSENHGVYILTLPEGAGRAGESVELSARLLPATDDGAWWGVRGIQDAEKLVP